MTTPMTFDQIKAAPLPVIKQGLAKDPVLHWGGRFQMSFEVRSHGKDEAEAKLALWRQETLGEWQVAQLLRAAEFLAAFPMIQSPNRNRGAYGWKHVAENYQRLVHPGADHYVGEGMFLIAAQAMGFTVTTTSQCRHMVNLSERAASETRARREAQRLGLAA